MSSSKTMLFLGGGGGGYQAYQAQNKKPEKQLTNYQTCNLIPQCVKHVCLISGSGSHSAEQIKAVMVTLLVVFVVHLFFFF